MTERDLLPTEWWIRDGTMTCLACGVSRPTDSLDGHEPFPHGRCLAGFTLFGPEGMRQARGTPHPDHAEAVARYQDPPRRTS